MKLRMLVGALASVALSGAHVQAATIEGKLAYPGEETPAMVIVAYNLDTSTRHTFDSPAKARRYRIEVPGGRYYVYALSHEGGPTPPRGAYSAYTVCGQRSPQRMQDGKCNEHRVLELRVADRERRADIDLDDWYLPQSELDKLPTPRDR